MFKREFKAGDMLTVKRGIIAGTNFRYVLSRMNGGVVLLDEKVEKVKEDEKNMLGGEEVQTFTFQFVEPGEAEIQFAQIKEGQVIYEEVFPYVVLPAGKKNVLCGGWSNFEPVKKEELEIFRKAVNLKGVDYTPVLVARQTVKGVNYRFFCTTKTVTEKPVYGFAMVNTYAEPGKEPKLESIVAY